MNTQVLQMDLYILAGYRAPCRPMGKGVSSAIQCFECLQIAEQTMHAHYEGDKLSWRKRVTAQVAALGPDSATFNWMNANCDTIQLTVEQGTTLERVEGGDTDEGHSWTREAFKLEGEWLHLEVDTRVRDCDGRHYNHWVRRCHVSRLAAWNSPADGQFPDWQDVAQSGRDYSAEAMNY